MNTFWCDRRTLCHIFYSYTVLSNNNNNKYNTHTHTATEKSDGPGSAPQSSVVRIERIHAIHKLQYQTHTQTLAPAFVRSATDQPKVLIFENDRPASTTVIIQYTPHDKYVCTLMKHVKGTEPNARITQYSLV